MVRLVILDTCEDVVESQVQANSRQYCAARGAEWYMTRRQPPSAGDDTRGLGDVMLRGRWQVAVRRCRRRVDRAANHDSTYVAEFRAVIISRSLSRCFCPEVVLRGVSRILYLVLTFDRGSSRKVSLKGDRQNHSSCWMPRVNGRPNHGGEPRSVVRDGAHCRCMSGCPIPIRRSPVQSSGQP